jgi:hypothetical protein
MCWLYKPALVVPLTASPNPMNLLTEGRSILFLRVPKCGSTFTRKHLVDEVVRGHKRLLWAKQDRDKVAWQDFRRAQLEDLVTQKNAFVSTEYFAPLGTAYNRFKPHWEPEQARSREEADAVLKKFRDAGWFIFSFLREPGDLICSMYHYGKDTPATTKRWYCNHEGKTDHYFYWFNPSETLDQFVGRDPMPMPNLYFDWRELDYIKPFTPETYRDFCRTYFDKDVLDLAPKNKSSNRGYDYYCQEGLISPVNQRRIRESAFAKIYDEVAVQTAV